MGKGNRFEAREAFIFEVRAETVLSRFRTSLGSALQGPAVHISSIGRKKAYRAGLDKHRQKNHH